MKLYGALLRISIQDAIQNRVESAIWFLYEILPPIMMASVWLAAYQDQPSVAGYSLAEMLAYTVGVIKYYIGRVSDEIATQEWDKVERAGLDGITFAWGGPVEKGAGHYYAIQGPTFIVEYDNTQNDSNHIHSVWRTFAGDWGEDILAQHYAASH